MKTQLFINSAFVNASKGAPTPLVNPATDETFAEAQAADLTDVDRAVTSADKAWRTEWRDLAPGKRTELLFAISRKLKEKQEQIARLEMLNVGKPIADARDEAGLGARIFEYYAGAVTRFGGQTIPVSRGGFDYTLRQSMGVIAAIVPWNFPFPIACWKVAPALAAGNTVILKPASLSPLTALALAEACAEAGLPAGVLQVLPGSGGKIGDALVTHPLVRKVSFTGSTEIGARIMAMAAADIKRISLELGGKSPCIVFADADVKAAAKAAPMSVFANTGQDCCARSRFFVEASVYDEFVAEFVAATRAIRVGDPTDDQTQVGPMVSADQRGRVEEYIEGLQSSKRDIVVGGDRPSAKGAFLSPTIALNVETSDAAWREEIFGPVACVRKFTDEETMLQEVNDSPYGLSGSIWTNDLKRALRVSRRVESGVLSVNSNSSVHVEAPFGGFKRSGLGRDLGMEALAGYTELKNVYIQE
ncbi:MAG TPA: aldehyde dehydrogenase family protein [Methylomirabilota bacterium]|nr:aldehyde dehydrogenase family protein [Methylomirabilota bacterium]